MASRLRRKLLKASALMLFLPVYNLASKAYSDTDKPLQPLIDILRAIGKPVCLHAAETLSEKHVADKSYSLHLRNADLNSKDAEQIGRSINMVHAQRDIRLRSFSASYNIGLGKQGIGHLLAGLPNHLGELGLVDCNLDDASAYLIIEFIARSQSLQMICVEDNNFSVSVKDDIRAAGAKLDSCVTIV